MIYKVHRTLSSCDRRCGWRHFMTSAEIIKGPELGQAGERESWKLRLYPMAANKLLDFFRGGGAAETLAHSILGNLRKRGNMLSICRASHQLCTAYVRWQGSTPFYWLFKTIFPEPLCWCQLRIRDISSSFLEAKQKRRPNQIWNSTRPICCHIFQQQDFRTWCIWRRVFFCLWRAEGNCLYSTQNHARKKPKPN